MVLIMLVYFLSQYLLLRSKLIKKLHDTLSEDKNDKGHFKLPKEPDINSIAGIKINSLDVN